VFLKKLLPILLTLLLTGCSNTFVYNQMDWLIPWYVGDFLSLNGAQKQSFKSQLLPLLDWHRNEELQTYLVILDSIESDLDTPVSADVVSAWADQAVAAYERLKHHGITLSIALAEQMSDLQLQYFMEEMYLRQEDLEKEYLPRSEVEFREQTYDNFEEAMSSFMGPLEKRQLDLLHEAAAEILRFDSVWLTERRIWLQRGEILLQRKPGWQQAATDLLVNRKQSQSAEFKAANLHNENIIYAAVADVIELRTEKQDQELREQIKGFRRDINKLIAQGQESGGA
jgi:hypothetical protein